MSDNDDSSFRVQARFNRVEYADLEEDLNRFREARCGGDCGCQSPYDACFVGCGGKISTERRCIANCPAGK